MHQSFDYCTCLALSWRGLTAYTVADDAISEGTAASAAVHVYALGLRRWLLMVLSVYTGSRAAATGPASLRGASE